VRVKDINLLGDSLPGWLTEANGMLFFRADDGTKGQELWMSDGTEEGTVMVKDINPAGDSEPYELIVANGGLFFSATDGTTGFELWAVSLPNKVYPPNRVYLPIVLRNH
jgi:ELWxxDGT repeat protein